MERALAKALARAAFSCAVINGLFQRELRVGQWFIFK
jgi:hypothetical protein